ncbi:PLDc N-terminal domain-containing protein [bacterium]|jgi:succinate dehydrogenase/fumarate reductase cytochrome b subunit|nr:PLDc N-terminal domain-containing protein [Pseudomonadales bacterium]MDB4452911.1 PLDc N-terminal domain-containing protein [bacterium]MDB4493188.1 PLDc N-terminal domain-containing protein [Pseudomonadales bacterium]MDB4576257.1 PLDc N-terminal domain-containing protein [bacterium]MDB4631552.1 PLDc N-terminal domain-containing protein [Pseudomonadales bacterium]
MDMQVSGFFGLLILIADVWAILNILQSSSSMAKKCLWVVVILMLPLIGLIIWWLFGPREAKFL